jgi:hypothetical protein
LKKKWQQKIKKEQNSTNQYGKWQTNQDEVLMVGILSNTF